MLGKDDGNLPPCDLVSLSETLRVCNMEMVLLNADGPRAIVDTIAQGEAFVCSAQYAFSFRARLTLPASWCLLGYIHHTDESSWCQGLSLSTDTAVTLLPDDSSEFMFAAGSRFTLMMLPLQQLREKFSQMDPRPSAARSRPHPLFRLTDPVAAQRLRSLYEATRREITEPLSTCATEHFSSPPGIDMDALLEAHISASLAVTADDLPNCSRSRRKHYLIVQRTEQFMRANMRNDIYVNQMCNAAEVSERGLRYAFEELLGISPNRYLSMLRLCTACRSLASSHISPRSVKSVALSCGLWDLSRFADSYRRVFGELPHDTLMRTPVTEVLPIY
jgi:AraC family ethanolamine operon transcriptional activator